MVSWSHLTGDVLEHITSLLILTDHHRFSAVCHHWRVVAKQRGHPVASELPWLVLGEDETTRKRNLFNMSERRHYSIDIPELYGQYICGSSYGWLFTVDKKINARLLNPFTKEFYVLPSLPPFIKAWPTYTFDTMQKMIVRKAVLSHDPREGSDFIVLIVVGTSFELALWRPGETVWTIVSGSSLIVDVICFEGNYYARHCNHKLLAVDVGSRPSVTFLNYKFPELGRPTPIAHSLVDLEGKLLVVQMLRHFPHGTKTSKKYPVQFRILHVKEFELCELHDIDDLALFVGSNSALVFDPSKISGCVENRIYFADMDKFSHWKLHPRNIGVYDVVERRAQMYRRDKLFHPTNAELTLLSPNP